MKRTIELKQFPMLDIFVGNKSLQMCRHGIDGRLGVIGLSKIVKQLTGEELDLNTVYAFYVKNRNMVKVLKKSPISINILEFNGSYGKKLKEYFMALDVISQLEAERGINQRMKQK